ncbi:hypothetical protein KY290_034201 [Solanum tuberosum]|uniref:Uncharacterized protein n=1 Tax=Solanum tuberosum TaxID=4113 RepID=A0ABQ7U3W0_SOLTU|nr:hypothetical protein KY289_033585 [Solanum tuberosum]KAH0648236.1 hypothetical protein KY285_033484 [Solanum tuberosum]KAH0741158.1 hypothetical protein KY290_034201 [Solanum tuberosum]
MRFMWNSNSKLDNKCMNWINQSDHKLPASLLDSELEGHPSGKVLGLCLHSWDRNDILGVSIDNEGGS